MADAGVGEGVVEEAASVAEAVGAQNPFDHDALGPEPGFGSTPEGCCRVAFLVGEDLGVGEAAVVVDGGVEVGVTDPPLSFFAGLAAARPRVFVATTCEGCDPAS